MKIVLLTLTYLVGAGELILAIYFWVTNSKSEIRRVMALLAFSTGAWVIFSGLSAYTTETAFVDFALALVYVFGTFLMTALVHFSIIYPYPTIRFDWLHKLLLYVPAVIFSMLALLTKTIVSGIDVTTNTPGKVISGPLHHTYNYYLLVLFLVFIVIILFKIRRAEGPMRNNMIAIFVSIIIGGGIPVWLDLITPNFGLNMNVNYLYGNISTVAWLGVTTFIVMKK